jgi:hypothetical protein
MLETRQQRKARLAAWSAYVASMPEWCAGFSEESTRDALFAAVVALRDSGWTVSETHIGSTYLTKDGKACRVSDHSPVGGLLHASHRNVHYHVWGYTTEQINEKLAEVL